MSPERKPYRVALRLAAGACLLAALALLAWPLLPRRVPLAVPAAPQAPVFPAVLPDFGRPVRVEVPAVGIAARVTPVGLARSGAMAVPASPARVGWYRGSAEPGDTGTAVLAGHRGWSGGRPAAFDALTSVRPGDAVLVTDAAGRTARFVVASLRTYRAGAAVPAAFDAGPGRHLTLITCTGAWNALWGTHSERLVVSCDAA